MSGDGVIAIAAAITMCSTIGAAVMLGYATSKVADGCARNPEASNKIMSSALIFATLAEVTAIFCFVIAILLVGKIG
jgi:F0F1-type ATP synthase membrane subunit c/vacuolar-type H+-ATPase subunit K